MYQSVDSFFHLLAISLQKHVGLIDNGGKGTCIDNIKQFNESVKLAILAHGHKQILPYSTILIIVC